MSKSPHHVLNFFLKKTPAYFLVSISIVFKYDLYHQYSSNNKIPFSLYIIAKNMDLNSRVKPIEISQDKLDNLFTEQFIQHEIKRLSLLIIPSTLSSNTTQKQVFIQEYSVETVEKEFNKSVFLQHWSVV